MDTTVRDGGAFEWRENRDLPGTVTLARYRGNDAMVAIPARTEPEGLLVTRIDEEEAFKKCSSLRHVEIPGSVREIGKHAFFGCTSLRSAEIPEGARGIAEGAFEDRSSLESVTIPESVEHIGRKAFSGCTSLAGVEIPGSVREVGSEAFQGCASLRDVYFRGTEAQWGELGAGLLASTHVHFGPA